MAIVDISELAKDHRLDLSVVAETEPERDSRLRVAEADAKFMRWRELVTHVLVVAGLIAVGALCFMTVASSTASAEEKKWAMAALTTMVGGGVGFLTGKAVK